MRIMDDLTCSYQFRHCKNYELFTLFISNFNKRCGKNEMLKKQFCKIHFGV